MIESLKDLNGQLNKLKSRLFFFHGEVEATFLHVLDQVKPDAVFLNEDVTPYALKRDNRFEELCKQDSIKFYHFSDVMLVAKDKILLSGGRFYQKFTPYYKTASSFPVNKPEPNIYKNYIPASQTYKDEYKYEDLDNFYKKNDDLEVRGGRTEALKVLKELKKFANYQQTRDFPALATTRLSAHNKFGNVSIREVYHTAKDLFGASCTFIQQLFWRDFYYNIAFYFPHVFGNPMKAKYKDVEFENDPALLQKWKDGMTGCPIVDAAMRHLNKKGYVPNRLRMVVSNYLIKDLLVHWKLGEQHFAQNLVDYDPSQNSGGWQWAAGCGTDSQPYFRVFNPKLQSEKFDQDCEYILTWIPELKDVKKEHIHDWEEHHKLYKGKNINYPAPIVNHQVQKKKFLHMYKVALYGDNLIVDDEEEEKEETKGDEEEEKSAKKKKVSGTKKAAKPVPEPVLEPEEKKKPVKNAKKRATPKDTEIDDGYEAKKTKKTKDIVIPEKSPVPSLRKSTRNRVKAV